MAALLAGSCATRVCTEIGCVNGAHLVAGALDPERMPGALVRVCRNARCASGAIAQLPTAPNVRLGVELEGDLSASASVSRAADGLELTVEVGGTDGYPYGLVDGDTYELEIHDADGVEVARRAWTATYTERYANGPDCDPFPCRRVSLDAP